ncbi:hypothetical protein GCM10007424_26140 [Flavobacterium suaedae]|uniref:Uncharacterized protein n=1 Tax=Flavobacterium suaedae TaxID=1767027 RepID=A0ABQ1K6E6_9FLAO|nr:hypothetical protein GCM10007424_26140 [Flavobacterium suaedae]
MFNQAFIIIFGLPTKKTLKMFIRFLVSTIFLLVGLFNSADVVFKSTLIAIYVISLVYFAYKKLSVKKEKQV